MWRGRWAAVVAALFVAGCSYPERRVLAEGEEAPSSVVSVGYLKSHYRGYPYTFAESYRIRGRVVSSDRSGNYRKTLAVLDGTGAIEVKLDGERLFETYGMGCTVEVSCNGLTLGSYGGGLQLGTAPSQGYETGYVDEADIPSVVRVVGIAEGPVEPQVREIAALSPADVGRLVVFDEVEFVEGGRAAWCACDAQDPSGFVDTDRYAVDRTGAALAVRTSRYAGFASWPLPRGSGRLEGILSVFNGRYQVRVVRPDLLYSDMVQERF